MLHDHKLNTVRRILFSAFTILVMAVSNMHHAAAEAHKHNGTLKLAITTSFENSGLAKWLLPHFENTYHAKINLIAVGTGHAFKLGERGDVDLILVHAENAEKKWIKQKYGIMRRRVMYNDFIIAGPKHDPANIKNSKNPTQALKKIYQTQSPFISRGDESGTHKKEMQLWQTAKLNPENIKNTWYKSTGTGMGATLNIAAALNAYLIVDRGTWLNFPNKQNLQILNQGSPIMRNQYGIMIVNPEKHPHINLTLAQNFLEWITSQEGQNKIAQFKINGETPFTPNYQP